MPKIKDISLLLSLILSQNAFALETWSLPADHELFEYITQKASRHGTKEETELVEKIITAYLSRFPIDQYAQLAEDFDRALGQYTASKPFTAYHLDPDQPRCEKSSKALRIARMAKAPNKGSSFPGGIVNRVFGFDFGKLAFQLLEKASGPASASSQPVQILTSTALAASAGLIQTIVSSVIHVVPPLIPPPIWINMPLPCLPMLTGHNCFGAILHLITAADFASATVTDKSVAGYIAGFPKLYYSKVGTSSSLYAGCFSAYMSMHCASIFPMCTMPLARDEPIPFGGRAPMCFYHCILTLVACPGFWLDDIMSACTNVALGVPPMCTTALFWNLSLLPPQYVSLEDTKPAVVKCPKQDLTFGGLDTGFDIRDQIAPPESPILNPNSIKLSPSGSKFLELKTIKHH